VASGGGDTDSARSEIDQPPLPTDLTFTGAGNLYATHGLHPFAARCPPGLADWAIRRFSQSGEVVLDPMSGSGTALVEASMLGRTARGADIDPIARLIGKVKATPVDLAVLDKMSGEVFRLLQEVDLDEGWRPELPDWERWFRPDVARDLSKIRDALLRAEAHQDVTDLLWVCFSSLIIARTSVANARDLVHSRHHFRAWEEDPETLRRFEVRVRRARRMMADYLKRLEDGGIDTPDVDMVGGEARGLALADDTIDLVFTSPPYCSALDYTRAHLFAVAWMSDVLGVSVDEYRRLGRSYVGSERAPLAEATADQRVPPLLGEPSVDRIVEALHDSPKRAWIVHRYFRDMRQMLAECARVVRPGGHIVLVVCPSNIRRVVIPTHRLLVDLARNCSSGTSLELVDSHERTIHDHRRVMPYLEASFGPRMRTEYVLVLRRPLQTGRQRR
jgi:SAM-dependent methyltransferase